MAFRSQPYRIEHPLTPEQIEAIDEMFQILFDDLAAGATFPFEEEGDLVYFDGDNPARLAIGDPNTVLRTDGVVPEWDKVQLDADVTDTLPVDNGGTGITSYTIGDLLYASAATVLSKLAAVATGNVLISGGVATAPSWGKVGLTTHVSGTLPIANGGTNSTDSPTDGGIAYGDGTQFKFTAQGNFGEVLVSLKDAAPIWSPTQFGPNLVVNGGFRFSQRNGNTATLTTISDTASRTFCFDRWAITNENASVQTAIAQTHLTPETGVSARHYGRFVKITNAGKICISQAIYSQHMMHTRGDFVRLQVKLKASTSMDVRIALLELQAAGTVDVIPGYTLGTGPSGTFISAFGVDGTDPTFGTNLAKITPTVTGSTSTIENGGVTCPVTTSWARFWGIFPVPTDCKNLVVVIFSDNDMAVADELDVTEVDLHMNGLDRDWYEEDYNSELAKCNMTYEKSFGLITTPATAAGLTGAVKGHVSVAGATAGQPIGLRYKERKIGNPLMTFYNPSAANAFARNTSVGADSTATAFANNNADGGDITFTGVAGWLAGAAMAVHYTADGEF